MGQLATTTATDESGAAQASNAAPSITSTTLTPDQVRSQLRTLIAGQVEAGTLTNDQGAALHQAVGPQTGTEAGSGSATQEQPATAEPAQTYKPSEILATFISNLQRSQAAGASYGSTGAAPARSAGSRVLDFSA